VDGSNNYDVSVLLGKGTGGFTVQSTTYPVSTPAIGPPTSIATADLDGDGNLDLVVAIAGVPGQPPVPGSLAVLLGNGNGTFKAATTVSLGIAQDPNYILIADFNGDSKLDL